MLKSFQTVLLEAVARTLPDPIFVFDVDGRYLHVLGGAERRLYDDGQGLVGRSLPEVLPVARSRDFLARIRRAVETGSLQIFEYELGPEDIAGGATDGPASRQWFEGRIAPVDIPDHDKSCVIWVAINITKRKRAEQALDVLAHSDPLTGIMNRRSFLAALEKELSRQRRYRQPAALAILDIDHFKRVNDTYGHPAGDAVIIGVIRQIQSGLRKPDLLGRIGGEEFGILFPGVEAATAATALERLRVAIEANPVATERGPVPVTVSAGVTGLVAGDVEASSSLNRADAALYAAKDGGRNQVRVG